MNNEQNIIEQTLIHLQAELGEELTRKHYNGEAQEKDYDAIFRLAEKDIFVKTINEVRPQQIHRLLPFKDKYGEIIIAANYITPAAKKLLKENEINYIDRAGNTWFRQKPVYIHIEGLYNQPPTEDRKNRAFTKAGIKVVYQFLLNPDLINATYREIVEVADVALGTIPKVFNGLKEEGFILRKTEDEWIIKDREKLIKRWQIEYERKLKPTLFIERYRPIDPEFNTNWEKLELTNSALWGGEPAGDLHTQYLKPELFTLYTNQTRQDIMQKYKWVPDPEGVIYVYKQFWGATNEHINEKCVPPLLAYADLIETGDSRCIETANMIYEQHLQKH